MPDNPDDMIKMAALGRETKRLTHDINNSLGSIMGYAEFLIEDLPQGTEQHNFAINIQKAGYQIQEIIEQIRLLSKNLPPQMEKEEKKSKNKDI
jgi:signal transduction histidine kinase